MLVIGANVRFEKRRSSCLSSRIVEETCCPRSGFVCEVSLGARSGRGGVGRTLVDRWPVPRVARRSLQDRGRRLRRLTRFTIRTLSPAISVNALFGTLYRSIVLVIVFFVSLGDLVLFRCAGSFWLAGELVRYLTGKTF